MESNRSFGPSTLAMLGLALHDPDSMLVFVESSKGARKTWISSGLPRESIGQFLPYDEQNSAQLQKQLPEALSKVSRIFLIVDEGEPCLFDPGLELVQYFHEKKWEVSTLDFQSSVQSALALSGFYTGRYHVHGFPAQKTIERLGDLQDFLEDKQTCVCLDTAYRLKILLEQLATLESKSGHEHRYFLGQDLERESQTYFLGSLSQLLASCGDDKKDFVLVKEGRGRSCALKKRNI
jgi:16S rRNA (cytidine1402-2'-O)-methyltransferase